MRLVIDARMIRHGGIGTYLRSLIPHFLESGWDVLQLTPEKVKAPIYSFQEQAAFLKEVPPCDLFWSPHFNVPFVPLRAKKRVVTIHDVFHLDQELPLAKGVVAKMMLSQAVRKSDLILTVSEFSKGRILTHFPEAAYKLIVIHSGADHLVGMEPAPVDGLPETFFLFVGNLKPHKNVELLLHLLDEHHLVIAGKGEILSHPNLHHLGEVSDAQLVTLYKRAEALLFPSMYEGWGLPPLEAMALGCPVIASNCASLPEACEDGALYIDPTSLSQLKEAIETLKEQRSTRISAGTARAMELSWHATFSQHYQRFAELMRP